MQQIQQNISRENETLEIIYNKLEHILEQSPNSIRNFFRKRKIDIASISINKNPLLKAIQEELSLPKIHALIKNYSQIQNKKHITKTDIEMIKIEVELNKNLIEILNKNDIEALKHFLEKESINLNFFKNENNPIMYAIRNGKSIKLIQHLLQYNIDINFHELNGGSPLTEAVILNNKEVFNLLLKKGADPNHLNYAKETPLLYLIKNDIMNKYYLSKFIEYNANLDIKDNNKNTILLYLTKNNNDMLIEYLLKQIIYSNSLIINLITLGKNKIGMKKEELSRLIDNGYSKITVDTTDEKLNTPLMYACKDGYYNIVSTLLTYKADINKDNIGENRPLFYACYNGDSRIAKLLLETGKVEVNHKNKNGDTELTISCLNDNAELINLLIKYHSNIKCINNKGHYPVHIASINDKLETLKALCAHGADVKVQNAIGNQCFSMACINENIHIINYLLTHDIDINYINYSGDSALHQCCILQKKDIIKKLLSLENINIDVPNSYGFTPFIIACKKNDFELAKLILDQNKPVNIDAKTNSGDFPLFYATYYKNKELLQLLFDHNVNIYTERTAKRYVCYTAFHIACGEYGNEELIQFFIDNGVDVNRPNSMDVYPLYEACKSEIIEHVELLLKNGANPNVQASSITPFIQACIDNNMKMVDVLIKGGANVNYETINGVHPLNQLIIELEKKNSKLIQYLISKGANLYSKDTYGNSILYILKNSNKIDKEEIYENLIMAYKDRNDYQNRCPDTTAFIATYDIYNRVMEEINPILESNPENYMDIDTESLQKKFTQEELDRTYLQACIFGKMNEVKALLEIFPSININVRETNGDTPLIIACQTGHADIALYLLDHGADPNLICECGNTALYVATFSYDRHESIELMESLLKHGANPNILCQYCLSPLMIACKDKFEEVTKLLLQYDADPNMQDSEGNTALTLACNRNNQSIVEILLTSDKIDINKCNLRKYNPLIIACSNSSLDIAKTLIQEGANIYIKNNYHQTAFQLSCFRDFISTYDDFLMNPYKMDLLEEDDHGRSVYITIKLNGTTSYFQEVIDYELKYLEKVIQFYECAQKKDLPEEAVFYIEKESYDNFDSTLPSHNEIVASYKKKLEYMEIEKKNLELYQKFKSLFQQSELNLKGLSQEEINLIFIYATIHVDVKIVYQLFELMRINPELNIDINATDQDGNTSLHYACASNRYEWDFVTALTKFLLKQPNINKNVQNNQGFTPLAMACFRGNENIGRILISDGVDVNIPTYKGETPLMMTCYYRNYSLIDLLIQHQANVNVHDNINGNTPLTLISECYYSFNILKMLIEKGNANVNIANWEGESPLTLACHSNNIGHIKELIKHGADVNFKEKKTGLTPLMIVLSNFNYYVGNYLCQNKANINECNNNGETALIIACRLYNKYGSELLIKNHADISIKDHQGQTAKSIINKNNFNFIIGL